MGLFDFLRRRPRQPSEGRQERVLGKPLRDALKPRARPPQKPTPPSQDRQDRVLGKPANQPARRPGRVPGVPLALPRGAPIDGRRTTIPHPIGVDEIDRFANWGEKVFVTSSNVEAAQYDDEKHELLVWFLNGSLYWYGNISHSEAVGFITAPSKGGWVNDILKGPGYPQTHAKPYVQLS